MTAIKVKEIERTYKNFGMHAEQCLAYTLTGEIRKGGTGHYDKGSDIPEFDMSVKSRGFSLMSGSLCKSQDFDGIIEEFFSTVASKRFAYITQDMTAYIMDKLTFRKFVENFCTLVKESKSHGGRYKVRMGAESKKVIAFLQEKA